MVHYDDGDNSYTLDNVNIGNEIMGVKMIGCDIVFESNFEVINPSAEETEIIRIKGEFKTKPINTNGL